MGLKNLFLDPFSGKRKGIRVYLQQGNAVHDGVTFLFLVWLQFLVFFCKRVFTGINSIAIF